MTEYPTEIYEYLEQVRQGTYPENPDWTRFQKICVDEGLTELVPATMENKYKGTDGRLYVEEIDAGYDSEVLTGKGELTLLTRASQSSSTDRPATANERMAAMLMKDPSLVSLTAEQWAQKCGCSDGNIKQTATWKRIMENRDQCKKDRMQSDTNKHLR